MEKFLIISGILTLSLPFLPWSILFGEKNIIFKVVKIICLVFGGLMSFDGIKILLFNSLFLSSRLLVGIYLVGLLLIINLIFIQIKRASNLITQISIILTFILVTISLLIAASDWKDVSASCVILSATAFLLMVPYDAITHKQKK